MTEISSYNKELYLFELDDVLFPKRDYLLQVYYLFASFYEFTEGNVKAQEVAQFMSKVYDIHGEEQVFLATQTMFGIDQKYEDNFNRLRANAQLPLKLELFEKSYSFLSELINKNKKIAILTKGNPIEQLNKLKFINWGNLDNVKSNFKIFFIDELEFRAINPLDFIAEEYNLKRENLFFIDKI